jgi:hypothetical protein
VRIAVGGLRDEFGGVVALNGIPGMQRGCDGVAYQWQSRGGGCGIFRMLDRLESVATTDGECLDCTDWNASLRRLPVILQRMLWRSDVRRV